MEQFVAVPKKWGNSMGITIPKEVAMHERIEPQKEVRVFIMGNQKGKVEKIFGTLKLKKDTQKIMDEIDSGYDEH